jgi:hypothetical protein
MSLQGIVLFLFVGVAMIFTVMAGGLSIVFLAELRRFERLRQRQTSPRSDFLKRLLRLLSRNRIRTIGDVHQAYRAFFGVDVLRSSHLEDVAEFLQTAMRRIASVPEGAPDRLRTKTEAIQALLVANRRALDVERMCIPFSGTPEPERALLEQLAGFSVEDKAELTGKLDALAKAIRFREDLVERLGYERDRAVKLARWGCRGALVLGILSAVLGFLCLGL